LARPFLILSNSARSINVPRLAGSHRRPLCATGSQHLEFSPVDAANADTSARHIRTMAVAAAGDREAQPLGQVPELPATPMPATWVLDLHGAQSQVLQLHQ